MKICMISGGHLPIPSKGWGGVEVLLTNYLRELESLGHEVLITNTTNLEKVIEVVNEWKPDFVHLHYDGYAKIMEHLDSPKKAMTSHYPYIDYPDRAQKDGYSWIFNSFILQSTQGSYIFGLSDLNGEIFKEQGASETKFRKWVYGIPSKNFKFTDSPKHKDKSICLGKIEPRKKQSFLQTVGADIDFAGPISDKAFWSDSEFYLGQWTREQVHNNLTEYANLILLSDGESAPQVVYEGLMSGCGLVLSKEASANLDTSLPFIDVVDSSISRFKMLEIIEKNREVSLSCREEIREYGIKNFSIETCVKNYVNTIKGLGESK